MSVSSLFSRLRVCGRLDTRWRARLVALKLGMVEWIGRSRGGLSAQPPRTGSLGTKEASQASAHVNGGGARGGRIAISYFGTGPSVCRMGLQPRVHLMSKQPRGPGNSTESLCREEVLRDPGTASAHPSRMLCLPWGSQSLFNSSLFFVWHFHPLYCRHLFTYQAKPGLNFQLVNSWSPSHRPTDHIHLCVFSS